jgi:hypothetical protein
MVSIELIEHLIHLALITMKLSISMIHNHNLLDIILKYLLTVKMLT